jgi:DNA (cytosine-5)-methyltransferase 1
MKRANRMKNRKIFKLGELFSGPGGIAVGALRAHSENEHSHFSIEHAWATDYDKDTCLTYQTNIAPDRPETVICKDIRTLEIPKLKKVSPIDALAFGFPCNDFSIVGEQKGINGVFGPLYMYGVKVLKAFQPEWFLAENVGGLKNSNEGTALKTILSELFKAGYSVYPHLYKFDQYGVPQARHRIIIVGIRKDLDVVFNVPSTESYKHIDTSCRNAIENPPIPVDAANNEQTRQSHDVIERLKLIKPGENVFTANLPPNLQLNVKGARISQIYKRLDPKKPAYTVTGSGGGGTHMYHWKENRALTSRERARLQTFPDDFVFQGSKESVRKQVGMAVPCRGAEVVFNAILNSFAGQSYPSIPCSFPPLIQPEHLFIYNNNSTTETPILMEKPKVAYGRG